MRKYVWNKVTKCRVPYNSRLDVVRNDNLEWREEAEGENFPESIGEKTIAEATDAVKADTGITVQEAIAKLDPENKNHFTSGPDPKPNAKVLSELCNRNVSADERDKEWVTYQAFYKKGMEV